MKRLTVILTLSVLLAGVSLAQGSLPQPPENLTVSSVIMGAKLQWDSSAGAFGYRVYKSIDTFTTFKRIDEVSGTDDVDRDVSQSHTYRYYVTAYNRAGESDPSNDVVFSPDTVAPTSVPHGYITGNIVDDSTGLPVSGAKVRFFRPSGWLYFRQAGTDSLGNYVISLDTGSYYISASKCDYLTEWYNDCPMYPSFVAGVPKCAVKVSVDSGNTSVANFSLHNNAPSTPNYAYVSGKVLQADSSNAPIKGATVVALRTNRELNAISRDGSAMGSRSDVVYLQEFGEIWGVLAATHTDSGGNFTLKISQSKSCIFLATKTGYVPQFYNQKQTFETADIVLISGDTSGIDFSLAQIPTSSVDNSISGTVKDSEGLGVASRVVLFDNNPFKKSDRTEFDPSRCVVTDSLGNYKFSNLYPSDSSRKYYVKAVPFGLYAPAWYNADSCGTMKWKDADSVAVHGDVIGIDICVAPVVAGGLAGVGGKVVESGESTGDVQGATVYAISLSGQTVSAYDITASDGTFDIQDLAPGSYQVVVDKEGYSYSSTSTYTLSESNNFVVSDASLSINAALGVEQQTSSTLPTSYSLGQNYPNPFNPTTGISMSLPFTSRVTIGIYNVLGQLVTTLVSGEMSAGNYELTWSGKDDRGLTVGSGMYFYRMTAQSVSGGTQFSSVKKMMLIK